MNTSQRTFSQHLEELRKRIIFCVVTVVLASIFSYCFIGKLLPFITRPVGRLVFIQPQEAFVAYLKLALICGVFISLPVLIYQLFGFISAGLTSEEKRYIIFYGPVGFLFFLLGAGFAYLIVVPYGLRFLLEFGKGYLQPMISVSSYISFLGIMLLAFGVIFELPIAIVLLTKIGAVNPGMLRRNRRYVLLAIFIIAAILTPPDIFTQLMLALPLLLLYEFSILLCYMVRKK